MEHNVTGKEKKVKSACTMLGVFFSGVLLNSVGLFPNGCMAWLPYEIGRFFVIIFCFYGGVSILKDLTLYFMKGSGE